MNQPQNLRLADYYAKRAQEYERIYSRPERQSDLRALRNFFQEQLANQDVLEIPCGTGYWTQFVAQRARSIVGIDINEEVLEIARAKGISDCPVTFQQTDIFRLDEQLAETRFTAALCVFWWSHMRKAEIKSFLAQLARTLVPGGLMVFADNRFVPGSNTPISRTDSEGNTYQNRRLNTGEAFEVLKNFPARSEVETVLNDIAENVTWRNLDYFWLATARTGAVA